jgi:hypothetical protein
MKTTMWLLFIISILLFTMSFYCEQKYVNDILAMAKIYQVGAWIFLALNLLPELQITNKDCYYYMLIAIENSKSCMSLDEAFEKKKIFKDKSFKQAIHEGLLPELKIAIENNKEFTSWNIQVDYLLNNSPVPYYFNKARIEVLNDAIKICNL